MAVYDTKNSDEQKRATIRDNALILYFDTAETPSVARFDLDSLAQASFEIADKRENSYYITLRDFAGQSRDVARFGTKAEAHQALQAILQALLAQRDAPVAARKTCCMGGGLVGKILKWLLLGGLALLLFYIVLALFIVDPHPAVRGNAGAASRAAPVAAAPEGEAVDADSILPAAPATQAAPPVASAP